MPVRADSHRSIPDSADIAVIWDTEVPSDSIDVKVDDGWITLKGDVGYQFQSNAAYDDVASLYGVYGVTNEIKVNEP